MNQIIGRENELAILRKLDDSKKSEFVALHGRRRVGKTFLINNFYKDRIAFSMTGVLDGTFQEQLFSFEDAMSDFGYDITEHPKDWMSAFVMLKNALKNKDWSRQRCVIFLDELPAMDAGNSGVARAVGYFWNSWASKQDNVTLIICGSATSWMIKNVVDSKGGLHDRLTVDMAIHPFLLYETEDFLNSNGFNWNRFMTLQAYMIFGGVPYYLSLLNSNESLPQNIDRLFFSLNAPMRREFHNLYATLFKNHQCYMAIIEALHKKPSGLTREELSESLGISNNGHLGDKLDDLINCDLLREIMVRKKKINKTSCIYQLSDLFSIFYLTFIEKSKLESSYWSNHINTPEVNSWLGLSFEKVCMNHIMQIKEALKIGGVSTVCYAWQGKNEWQGAQIDIVIERADQIVNLCEVKYSQAEYQITKSEYQKLHNRAAAFKEQTGLRHAVWFTFITTVGVAKGMYSDIASHSVTLDDLFKK